LNYIINFISNFTVEMLLKYIGIQRDLYPIIKKSKTKEYNRFYLTQAE